MMQRLQRLINRKIAIRKSVARKGIINISTCIKGFGYLFNPESQQILQRIIHTGTSDGIRNKCKSEITSF